MKQELYKNLPDTPGVYTMKNAAGDILYVGKAANLKRRVSSYFVKAHDSRIEHLVSEIAQIDVKKTLNVLDALVLESFLIKKYQPPYNIKEKDDKSFLYAAITKEIFPRVILVRGKDISSGQYRKLYGPFVYASNTREALKMIRRIFPFNTHQPKEVGTFKRPCFDYEIGLCPGTCVGAADGEEYRKTIRNIGLILSGQTSKILKLLGNEMKEAAVELNFEKAGKIKRQISGLKHIRDTALVSEGQWSDVNGQMSHRIEGYDISNISGDYPVGSMVVAIGGKIVRSEYRRFKIKNVAGQNDLAMMAEVISRRFGGKHSEWGAPDLILVDGGLGQVNAAESVLAELGLNISVIGIAKGPERKNNRFVGRTPAWADRRLLIRLRDEAHRFAIQYHRRLRAAAFLG